MNDKIRILHMTPPIVNNGIYKYIFTRYKYIDKNRFEFDFLMQAPEELKKTKEWQKYHFGIRSFTTTQRDDPEKFRKEIYDILSDNYDVLELHTSYWRGFMIEEIAMELGVPKVIVHAHTAGLDQNDPLERQKQLAVHEKFKKQFGPQYATDFWACSKEAGEWLFGSNIPVQKIQVVKNAIEAGNYQYSNEKREKTRKELGLEGSFIIGHTGRFEYQKNHDFLVDVFEEVKRRNIPAKLLLAGEGKKKDDIKEKCRKLGIYEDVIFLGWRDDIEVLLQAMDVYCLPSLFEGLGLVAIEAQSADLPCVISDMVTKEARILSDCCYLELQVKLWADKIEDIYKHPKQRKENRLLIQKAGYDIETEIRKLEQLYEKGLK